MTTKTNKNLNYNNEINNNVKKEKVLGTKDIAILGVFFGIILAFTLLPQIGFIVIPGLPFGITTIGIPTLILAFTRPKLSYAFFAGLFFGVASLIGSFLYPGGLNHLFQNPLISVLPRIAFVLYAYMVYIFMSKIFKEKTDVTEQNTSSATVYHTLSFKINLGVATALGMIFHTFLVIGILSLVSSDVSMDALFGFKGILLLNGIPEAIVTTVAVIIIVPILRRYLEE